MDEWIGALFKHTLCVYLYYGKRLKEKKEEKAHI